MKPELLSSDLTTPDGVNDFTEALKTTNLTGLGKEAFDQISERIYSLSTDSQAEAIKAVIQSTETDRTTMCEMVGRVAAKARADKAAHQSQSKTCWRKVFTKFDMTMRRLRPLDSQVERRLVEIEEYWGIRIANRYMGLAPSVLVHLAAIAENVENSVAVAYLNAEVLARKERKASGVKGNVSPGHGITPGDAKSAKAKIQDDKPVPVLSADLLEKHKLRVSKNTGLLKPVEEDESDEECDFERGDEESGNGSSKEDNEGKNQGDDDQEQNDNEDEGEKGENSKDQSKDEPTHASVKRQSEQEDAQESEKRDPLSVGDVEVQDKEQSDNAANEDEDEKGEDSKDESKAGHTTCSGVKRQLEEQEDEQQGEKRVRLSVGDTEVHDQEQNNNAANKDEEKEESGKDQIEADPSTCTSEKRVCQSVSDADTKE